MLPTQARFHLSIMREKRKRLGQTDNIFCPFSLSLSLLPGPTVLLLDLDLALCDGADVSGLALSVLAAAAKVAPLAAACGAEAPAVAPSSLIGIVGGATPTAWIERITIGAMAAYIRNRYVSQ